MKKVISQIIILIFISGSLYGQQTPEFWNKVSLDRVDLKDAINYTAEVRNFSTYTLNLEPMVNSIDEAPLRFSGINSNVNLQVPTGDDGFTNFKIYKSNVLPQSWKNKYPQLKSFFGISDNASLRLTITPTGAYGMIVKAKKQILLNPITENTYMVFDRESASVNSNSIMHCQLQTQLPDDFSLEKIIPDPQSKIVNDGFLRSYRLAVAATGEYSQFHITEAGEENSSLAVQKQAVLAAMVVSIDRVNAIYERDFAITLELIDNNDSIIYLDGSGDPYSNFNPGALLSENQNNIDSVIGFPNYDIGHVFSTGGGGIASLGSVCGSSKARGVTGLSSPVGDPFDIDYVAHEIGHQFGATHTYNNSCNNNRTNSTAFEPGSGTTIMAYAGICGPNIQNNSDAVFHLASVSQVYNFIQNSNGASCATLNAMTNSAPVINTTLSDKTIPYGTPFKLSIDASDSENDILTYTWDQIDNEISVQPPDSLSTGGPNFRSLLPSDNASRFFPKYDIILNGGLSSTWEKLAWTDREMNFGLLVRDNNPVGGQTAEDLVTLNIADVGPFEVTSQSDQDINWQTGANEMITWNVNGTDANGINTTAVDILLSTDGGVTFDTVLASNIANDGSHMIIVPDIQAAFCRLMIVPVDNYYYAINSTDFSINTNVQTECEVYSTSNTTAIPDGDGQNVPGNTLVQTINVAEEIPFLQSVEVSVNISHTWISDLVIELESPDGTNLTLWDRNCSNEDDIDVTFSANAVDLPNDCSNPFTGTFKIADENGSLTDLIDEGGTGDWKLKVTDFWDEDSGILNSWSLDICYLSILSTQDVDPTRNFSITPNPASNNIIIRLSNSNVSQVNLVIYDMNGRVVKKTDIEEDQIESTIDTSDLSSGIYLLKADSGAFSTTKKLIVR